jgi:hypothetical protein
VESDWHYLHTGVVVNELGRCDVDRVKANCPSMFSVLVMRKVPELLVSCHKMFSTQCSALVQLVKLVYLQANVFCKCFLFTYVLYIQYIMSRSVVDFSPLDVK